MSLSIKDRNFRKALEHRLPNKIYIDANLVGLWLQVKRESILLPNPSIEAPD